MIYRNHLLACASAASLAFGLCSVPAAAEGQQPASSPATDTASGKTGAAQNAGNDTQIVITAQKRSENVQQVPISVAAFSGQTLIKSNVTDISQIGKLASNYQATKSVQSSFMRVNIRGIGAIGNTTIEPSVAIFVDGAYVPRAGAVVSSLLDIDSVEVLRGPQGTLFGRNASVGALSLHSAAPRLNDASGRVTGEVGTGDRYKVDGYVNVPIGKQAALRFAGLHQSFRRLLAQQARRQDIWRYRRHGASRQLPRQGGPDRLGVSAPTIPRSRATGSRTSSSTRTRSPRPSLRTFRRFLPEARTPTSTTAISTSSSRPIFTTASGASTALCHGTSAAVRRCG